MTSSPTGPLVVRVGKSTSSSLILSTVIWLGLVRSSHVFTFSNQGCSAIHPKNMVMELADNYNCVGLKMSHQTVFKEQSGFEYQQDSGAYSGPKEIHTPLCICWRGSEASSSWASSWPLTTPVLWSLHTWYRWASSGSSYSESRSRTDALFSCWWTFTERALRGGLHRDRFFWNWHVCVRVVQVRWPTWLLLLGMVVCTSLPLRLQGGGWGLELWH